MCRRKPQEEREEFLEEKLLASFTPIYSPGSDMCEEITCFFQRHALKAPDRKKPLSPLEGGLSGGERGESVRGGGRKAVFHCLSTYPVTSQIRFSVS